MSDEKKTADEDALTVDGREPTDEERTMLRQALQDPDVRVVMLGDTQKRLEDLDISPDSLVAALLRHVKGVN